MFASNILTKISGRMGVAGLVKLVLLTISISLTPLSAFAAWKEIRTSAVGKTGWVNLVCEKSSGWNSCELDLVIKLLATPNQLVAIGEQSTIEATVTDANGDPVEAGVKIGWTATDGSLSAPASLTDANGKAIVVLTSSHTLGGSTVTASALDYGGSGSMFVPYIDKWAPYPSAYTSWTDYGAVYSCTGWSPDPSTVASGTWFTQSASCWQTQLQYRQDRVQSVVSGAVSNTGAPVALFQAVVVSISQAAVGTLVTGPVCLYDASNYIMFTHDCRGAGNPAELRINGAKVGSYAGQGVQNRPTYNYDGKFWYTGTKMKHQSKSCSGSDGVIEYFQACHD